MKRSKFSDEQILAIAKEGEAGRKVADLALLEHWALEDELEDAMPRTLRFAQPSGSTSLTSRNWKPGLTF